jgi:hypothetical protein
MDSSFREDVSAQEEFFIEVTAVTMAIVKAIAELGSLSGDRRPYLSKVLDAGLRDLEEIHPPHILDETRAAFLARAKARYIALIAPFAAS